MNKKTDKDKLIYHMTSFIDDLIRTEPDKNRKGKMIYMKYLFMEDYLAIVNKRNKANQNIICELDIIELKTPTSETKEDNSEESLIKFIQETANKEPDEPIKEQQIQKGAGVDESDLEKIKRKLNAAWAEQVKMLGNDLGLKPPKNKKTLSKADVINKIIATPSLHTRALKQFEKISSVKTETEN